MPTQPPVGTGDLAHGLARFLQAPDESGAVAARAFDRPDPLAAELLRPRAQLGQARAAGCSAALTEAAEAVDRHGDVNVLVGVDPDDDLLGLDRSAGTCHREAATFS